MAGLNEAAAAQLKALVAKAGTVRDEDLMMATLRLAAKWRSQMLANTTVAINGLTIQNGPFAGMQYVDGVAEGTLMARLIGSYESELHPHLIAFAKEGLDHVVDIGCAEGYYAVGIARLMPRVNVYAFDIDEAARTMCADLARKNGVADRVHIGGEFDGEEFAKFLGKRALFIVDIEGAERDLLDPDRYPALKQLNIIVETHPVASPGVTEDLARRFAPSHHISVVLQSPKTTPLPEWLQTLGHLDSLLSVWEWRSSPTPWLVMRPLA